MSMTNLGGMYTTIEADTRQLRRAESDIVAFAKKAAGAIGAIVSVGAIANQIKTVTSLAARYDTLGIVMNQVGKNAGYSNAQMSAYQAGLEATGISAISSREALTKMTQAQIDLSNSSKLARVAQDAAVIGNVNSSEAFERLVHGIQSAQTETLRTIGINVNFQKSYKDFAKTLGKTAGDLTEAEKAQARLNIVLEAGADIQGTYEASMDSAGKKAGSLARHVENLQVRFGQAFQPTYGYIVDELTNSLKDLSESLDDQKVREWSFALKDAIESTVEFAKGVEKLSDVSGSPDLLQLGVISGILLRFGPQAAAAAVAVTSLNNALENVGGPSIQNAGRAYSEAAGHIQNLIDVASGKRDWNTGALLNLKDIVAENLKRVEESGDKYVDTWQKTADSVAAAEVRKQKAIADSLSKTEQDYESHKNKIKGINDQIKQNQMSGDELVRSLKQSGMTESAKWNDLKKQAGEYAAASRAAFVAASQAPDEAGKNDLIKEAIRLADKAKSVYTDLNSSVERNGRTVITQAQGLNAAIQGVEGVTRATDAALSKLRSVEGAALDAVAKEGDFKGVDELFKGIETGAKHVTGITYPALKKGMDEAFSRGADGAVTQFEKIGMSLEDIKAEIDEVYGKLSEEVEGPKIEVPVEDIKEIEGVYTNVYKAAETGAKELTKTQTEETHKITKKIEPVSKAWAETYNKAQEASSKATIKILADIERIRRAAASIKYPTPSGPKQGYQTGGPLYHAATGRYFPGYGGGDKIDIKGEAGEFMIRKEANREAGVETSYAYNRGDWETVVKNLVPKMRTGGPIGPVFNGMNLGGAVSQSQSSDSVRNYYIEGSAEPITVRADSMNANKLLKELERKYRRRSS